MDAGHPGGAWTHQFRRARRVADGLGHEAPVAGGFGQDGFQPVVGRERLALFDPDRPQHAGGLWVDGGLVFGLDQLGQHLEVAKVIRRDGVEGFSGRLDEPHGRRIVSRRQRIDPRPLQQIVGGRGVAGRAGKGPQQQPVAIGLGRHDEVARIRDGAFMARRQEEVFPALAAVGAARPDVFHRAHPHVVDQAQQAGRDLDHGRAVRAQVQKRGAIDRLGIGRQHQAVGVGVEHRHRPRIVHAQIPGEAGPKAVHAVAGGVAQDHLHRALIVERVVEAVCRRGRGVAVGKGQRPEEGGGHFIGRRAGRGDRHYRGAHRSSRLVRRLGRRRRV